MGRPLNKRFFGEGDGKQIAITAKIGSAAEGAGFIVKQTGSSRYIVTVGADTGVVYLVDGVVGSLDDNEAVIIMKNEAGDEKTVQKIMSHRAVFFDGTSAPWSFDIAVDPTYEVADVEDGFEEVVVPVITISSQPTAASVTAPAAASFSVTASETPANTVTYQWEVNTGVGFATLNDGGVYSGSTTNHLAISDSTGLDGHQYRVVVSSDDANSVTSNAVTLTVAPAV